jgi:cell division protein FtsQ
MPVAAPSDKRFRRAHVPPGRRRAWRPPWRRLVPAVALGAAAALALFRGAELVVAADALAITRVTVEGTERMSAGEVLTLLQGLRGTNIVTADLESWRRKLLDSPWVADAAMRRVFPTTVAVVISERDPLGIGRVGAGLYLIDQRGMIIDEFGPSYAEFDLPIIDGLSAAPSENAMLVDEARALLAGRVLADLQAHPRLARRVSQIDVSDARDAVVILKDDPALIRVGNERFAERVQSYLDLAPRLRETVPLIDSVDLRFDERVYVRPVNRTQGPGLRAQGSVGSTPEPAEP